MRPPGRNSPAPRGTSSSGKWRARTTFSTWLSTTVYQVNPGVSHSASAHQPKASSQAKRHARPAGASVARDAPAAEGQRQADDDRRPDRPQRILGQPGGTEDGEARDHEPAARLAKPDSVSAKPTASAATNSVSGRT